MGLQAEGPGYTFCYNDDEVTPKLIIDKSQLTSITFYIYTRDLTYKYREFLGNHNVYKVHRLLTFHQQEGLKKRSLPKS